MRKCECMHVRVLIRHLQAFVRASAFLHQCVRASTCACALCACQKKKANFTFNPSKSYLSRDMSTQVLCGSAPVK